MLKIIYRIELNWADATQKRKINFKIHNCIVCYWQDVYFKIKYSASSLAYSKYSLSSDELSYYVREDRNHKACIPSTSSPRFILSISSLSTQTLIQVRSSFCFRLIYLLELVIISICLLYPLRPCWISKYFSLFFWKLLFLSSSTSFQHSYFIPYFSDCLF